MKEIDNDTYLKHIWVYCGCESGWDVIPNDNSVEYIRKDLIKTQWHEIDKDGLPPDIEDDDKMITYGVIWVNPRTHCASIVTVNAFKKYQFPYACKLSHMEMEDVKAWILLAKSDSKDMIIETLNDEI